MSGELRKLAARVRRRGPDGPRPDARIVEIDEEERRYLTTTYDETSPIPAGAAEYLTGENPRLAELRERFAGFGLPATEGSVWNRDSLDTFLDLRWFRGDSLITWHYRDLRRVSRLKFYVYLRYALDTIGREPLERLGEDGAFGCWTYSYPGHPTVSRDLLDSALEIAFLERRLGLSELNSFSVLDIGAGYGRLATRMVQTYPNLADYCCVDAVPESAFLCEYYLGHRGATPRARMLELDRIGDLEPRQFDLAVNVHSFSECPIDSIAAWVEHLQRLEIGRLLVIPNEPDELLSTEPDGSRRDFAPLLERAGFGLEAREPVFSDPAVAELIGVDDHFHLFERDR